jgi:hypothetical protein
MTAPACRQQPGLCVWCFPVRRRQRARSAAIATDSAVPACMTDISRFFLVYLPSRRRASVDGGGLAAFDLGHPARRDANGLGELGLGETIEFLAVAVDSGLLCSITQ